MRGLNAKEAVKHPIIQREVDRLQRIVEGQNYEIRKTLWSYSSILEKQRQSWQERRLAWLLGQEEPTLWRTREPWRFAELVKRWGNDRILRIERQLTLLHLDQAWAEHLAFLSQVREGIHLVGLSGRDPLDEFHHQAAEAFWRLNQTAEDRIVTELFDPQIEDYGLDGRAQRIFIAWTIKLSNQLIAFASFALHPFAFLCA